ncbi:hypothetical protein [Streptomyces melanosporofaciens]|uniref:Uncharacterized protein n=1 Tax=Streptomyces melanosporofaciens TaxID=67327 RepID=A0A1H4KPQ5_STRMJ|nr:hypothetical protein [Streptomyces melanosporofaciens]SEB60078.1 hypothetical protein SAMN04490356_0866 [Streptomyces melanosporofaciens]
MHISRDGERCHIEIFRRWRGPVIADGGDDQEPMPEKAQELLKAHGFVEHQQPPLFRWYELPPGLNARDENVHATGAFEALTEAGYCVAFDPELYDAASDGRTNPQPPDPAPDD